VTENELPEEIIQAAEHAAEIVRTALPAAQAAARTARAAEPTISANKIAQASGLLKSVTAMAARVEAQLREPLRMLAAYQSAQISEALGEPLRMMAAYQSARISEALGGPLRALAAYQAAQLSEVLRSARPAILAAQQWAEIDRNVKAMAIGPLLPYADQIALARRAGLAQLAELSVQSAATRDHTVGAQLTVTPTFTAVAEVTKAAPAERRQANNQAALVIALVWILAVTMPAAELKLPPEAQQYLNGLYATIGLALIVTWRINDNRKH
jgi:hypothetical protein